MELKLKRETHTFYLVNLKERKNLRDQSVDGKVILTWNFDIKS
jgi:hypothetical protein